MVLLLGDGRAQKRGEGREEREEAIFSPQIFLSSPRLSHQKPSSAKNAANIVQRPGSGQLTSCPMPLAILSGPTSMGRGRGWEWKEEKERDGMR